MYHLPCEFVETHSNVDSAVIWLHGLGASANDFVPIIPELHLPEHMATRFVFPHAPSIPITINGGMVMPGWYDILSMEFGRKIDTKQIIGSSQAIIDLIEREIYRGISSDRIVLAGFSQGGAVVYQAALSYDKPLAGVMALSSYFPTHDTINPNPANQNIPIQIFHGSSDSVVPESMAKEALKSLKEMGYNPEYRSYPMGHEVHPQEIRDISTWLQQLLA
jgi:phospholipase/carboxylesterase